MGAGCVDVVVVGAVGADAGGAGHAEPVGLGSQDVAWPSVVDMIPEVGDPGGSGGRADNGQLCATASRGTDSSSRQMRAVDARIAAVNRNLPGKAAAIVEVLAVCTRGVADVLAQLAGTCHALSVAEPVDQLGAQLAGEASLTCPCRGGQWSGGPVDLGGREAARASWRVTRRVRLPHRLVTARSLFVCPEDCGRGPRPDDRVIP